MMANLTSTDLISITTEHLHNSGYEEIEREKFENPPISDSKLFEDKFGVVAVTVFETWQSLKQEWKESQSWLVDILSRYTTRRDNKSWEGYLILMTPSSPPEDEKSIVQNIRYNISRVRKLVATGDELENTEDIQKVLRPLIPISSDVDLAESKSSIELLPEILAKNNIPKNISEELISAYNEQDSLMDCILNYVENDEN
jgi:hypothetical protein